MIDVLFLIYYYCLSKLREGWLFKQCLAETNLLIGAASKASYIVEQIYLRKGQVYLCRILPNHKAAQPTHLILIFASLLQLEIISSLISGAIEMNGSKYTQGGAKQKPTSGVRAYFILFYFISCCKYKTLLACVMDNPESINI